MRRDSSPPSSPFLGGLFDDDEPAVVAEPVPVISEPETAPVPEPEAPLAHAVANTEEADGEILWEGVGVANQRMDFGVLADLLRHIQIILKRLTPTQPFTLQAGVPQAG